MLKETSERPYGETSSYQALWPDRLIELASVLKSGSPRDEKKNARSQFWFLLNTVLQNKIRFESNRTGPINFEDLQDLASEKSLDLVNKFDALEWDLKNSTRNEVIAFLSSVARNGLIDHLRRMNRRSAHAGSNAGDPGDNSSKWRINYNEDPESSAERGEFAEALVICASALEPVHRKILMFRVFMGMSTRAIARHPDVDLEPGNTDVILQRCRGRMRECMRNKGFDINDIPPGTFAALWEAFGMEQITFGGE